MAAKGGPQPRLLILLLLCCFGVFLFWMYRSDSGNFYKMTSEEDQELLQHIFSYNPSLPTNYVPMTGTESHFNKTKHAMGNYVYNRLNQKNNGFFIECGAVDGLYLSNTIMLEREHSWTGLLVEADPTMSPILKGRNRGAWVSDACLATKPYPMTTEFKLLGPAVNYIPNDVRNAGFGETNNTHIIKCFPLTMMLDAIGVNEVDFFALDVEGVELDILRTIPWNRIRIRLISLEVVNKKSEDAMKTYMESIGYKKITRIVSSVDHQNDDVYEFQDHK